MDEPLYRGTGAGPRPDARPEIRPDGRQRAATPALEVAPRSPNGRWTRPRRPTWAAVAAGLVVVVGMALTAEAQTVPSGLALVPGGTFAMGDHHDQGNAEHPSDEVPIHTVTIDSLYVGRTEVTALQYCDYLNAAWRRGTIEVRSGAVYPTGGADILFLTRQASAYSRINWDGSQFAVLDGKESHPVTDVRWPGAAAFCNWRSGQEGLGACYDPNTWACDFSHAGYRLPTEAEWEFAARGGQYAPYVVFPWGDDLNADGTLANWPGSGDPFETGPLPWTTPVAFYDGQLHRKVDFGWPGAQETYQTRDSANPYGLYDMSGNVWEWCNDWYGQRYYAESPATNPPGPAAGTPMPDGQPYRVLRGGNWFNGEQYFGHGRVANRNPAYYRGPDDPDHPYYHVGFRVARAVAATGTRTATVTPDTTRPDGGGTGTDSALTSQIAPGAALTKLTGGLTFAEGPTADSHGNVFFTDVSANRIHRWSTDGQLSTFREDSGGANGLAFGKGDTLIACEGTNGRLVALDPQGHATVVTDTYQGTRYNQPNDLWVDPKGGIYFSDPVYGVGSVVQGGEHVYYLTPRRDRVLRVIADMVRPNGLVGTADGKTLYVADHGAGRTYRYSINTDGSLTGKALFAARGSDGMELDSQGNLYLTDNSVVVYDSTGRERGQITVPETPTNLCFGGTDGRTLFVTAHTSLYAIRMRVTAAVATAGQGGGQTGGGTGQQPGGDTGTQPGGSSLGSLAWDIGLRVNEPGASVGYTLFAPKHYTRTYLIDNAGQVVNTWDSKYEPGQSVHLLPDGHLLHSCFIKTAAAIGGGEGGRLEEYDWDGNLVWEFDYYTADYALHHDVQPLPNGHILALAVERKTESQCLAAGFAAAKLRDKVLFPDYVVEIEPIRPKGGRIVWQWHVWDHLIQQNDASKANYGVVADHPERIWVDANGNDAVAFWNHMNSIDYSPELDQVMLSVRGCSELWVIDHSTTTEQAAGTSGGRHGRGGDLLYRWGNPAAYGRGSAADQLLFQQHDTQWIEPGLPGAGHILAFNNGLRRLPPGVTRQADLPAYEVGLDWGYSTVDEMVPPMAADGSYTLADPQPYGPRQLAWTYVADPPTSLFAEAISGAQRLPNGNTLVCNGTSGILFEVTPAGQTVWKYVCPVTGDGPIAVGDSIPLDERGHAMNAIFKVHRYAPDYPGLAGRALVARGPVELDGSTTAVEDASPALPGTSGLGATYPNPFNATTTIPFTLASAGTVRLAVYNALGQPVAVLVNGPLSAGAHKVTWNAGTAPSGLYFSRLSWSTGTQTAKLLLVR